MHTKLTNILLTPGVENEAHIPFIPDAEVQVDGNRIVYAGPAKDAPVFEAAQTFDGEGALCMPGLVNLHTHTPMTLLRGVGGQMNLSDWLNQAIFPMEKHLDGALVRAGSDLGILEMLRFGTTSFCDMYFYVDDIARAVQDSGMRALLGHGVVDFDGQCKDLDEGLAMVERWHHAADDRIRISLAPHSEGATTEPLMRKVARIAKEQGLTIHVHVSETKADFDGCKARWGLTPPEYLEKMGVLDSPVIAAHCVWFTDSDIALFAERGATLVHNPVSNLKLASGIAPIAKMLDAGCKVALGTDGVASNNNLNLWEELKLMPMLQKGTLLDPLAITPAQALKAATFTGAQALGYDRLGLLKPGYLADLILVDVRRPNDVPLHDLESTLVYSTLGSDVTLTMVDGKVLYRNGAFLTLNEKDALARGAEAGMELARRTREAATRS